MAASHQRTPTFSLSNASPGIDEDDLLRTQRLLGGSDYYRQPWDAEPGLLRRPSYAPAPMMARYREEMMDLVRRTGAWQNDSSGGGGQEPVVFYELSLRDIVELPSAAKALPEGSADREPQRSGTRQLLKTTEKSPQAPAAPAEEMRTVKGVSVEEAKKKAGMPEARKRDVFRGQKTLESGVFMLKMFFLPAGGFGGPSRRQRRKEPAVGSKVTPAPKAIWCDEEKCGAGACEECSHQASGGASRSSSGGGSEASSGSPRRRRRRFAGCYSFLHAPPKQHD